MSIELVMPPNHLILCCPLLLLPSVFPSITFFSSESALCIRWSKYQSFSFSISPSNEYSGLRSFRIDMFDLLAVQGTLRSLLQHHSSKIPIIWCSTFFVVHLSHPYTITEEGRLIIPFLPRSKHLLISWLWNYVWTSSYYLFIYISCLCEYHSTLINVALQLVLRSKHLNPTLILVFKIVLAILYPLKIYVNLES